MRLKTAKSLYPMSLINNKRNSEFYHFIIFFISHHNLPMSLGGFFIQFPGRYIADGKAWIRFLTHNIINNACKYNNKAKGKVGITLTEYDRKVQVAIKDNGIGISKEHQKRVFERFYRVDKSRSKQTGGTGLGLAIVKHVAQVHNAEVSLISSEGQGTTIRLSFASNEWFHHKLLGF